MRKLKYFVFASLSGLMIMAGNQARAQQPATYNVAQVESAQGFFDITPSAWNAQTTLAVKNLANGENAFFKRLYIDEQRHIMRVEVANSKATLTDVQNRIREEANKSTSSR